MGIKIENLNVGQCVKNYKILCGLLDEKNKTGKSKQLQIKEWERYFSNSRSGNKFIIEAIYQEPKPKIDNRKSGNTNNNIYGIEIKELVIELLVANSGSINKSFSFFLNELGMVNNNYKFCEDKVTQLATLLKIDEYNIYEFYNLSRGNLRDIFETSLKQLEKKGILKWEKQLMVCITQVEIEKNELNTIKLDGKDDFHARCIKNIIHREANLNEIKLARETEEKLLNDMDYRSISQIIYAGKYNDFKKKLQKLLFTKGNIDYLYSSYKIEMDDIAYKQNLEKAKENESEQASEQAPGKASVSKFDSKLKSTLNDSVYKNMMKNADKRHFVTRKKYSHILGEVICKTKSDKCRYNADYPEFSSELNSVLISQYARDIKHEMNSIKLQII